MRYQPYHRNPANYRRPLKGQHRTYSFFWAYIIFTTLCLFGTVSCASWLYFNDSTIIATVDRKESVSSRKSHTYLIFTDKGVFENDDVFFRGKFNSSDFYNEIKEGHTYKFTVVGQRIPFLSMYKNIIKVEFIK